jgi:hypothetical protein
VKDVAVTHIGGPTVLIEVGGWRILTDPTFDAPGRRYAFGWATSSRKLTGPAIAASDLGRIDAVLLTHDHHDDNLDAAGRALLPSAGVVVTTAAGAERLGGDTRGLVPWATTRLELRGLEALPGGKRGDRSRARRRPRRRPPQHPLAADRRARRARGVSRYAAPPRAAGAEITASRRTARTSAPRARRRAAATGRG